MTEALVVGATGQVGGALVEHLGSDRVSGTTRSGESPMAHRLDLEELIRSPSLAEPLFTKPRKWVIIAAGWTWVDGCEGDPGKALRLNRDAPAILAAKARSSGAQTVYYSTEYVFDGNDGPYDECDRTRPLGVYGESKLEGERAVLREDPEALILRTTVVYGPEENGKNFAYRLVRALLAGESIRVPRDQISSPTYNRDLAAATVGLLEQGAKGVWNVTGAEILNRLEFSRRIACALDLDTSLIQEVDTSQLDQIAGRPLSAGLKIDKLVSTLPGLKLHNVEEAVADWRANPRGLEWPGA